MRNLICKCTLNNNGRDLAKEGKVIRTSLVNFPNWPKKAKVFLKTWEWRRPCQESTLVGAHRRAPWSTWPRTSPQGWKWAWSYILVRVHTWELWWWWLPLSVVKAWHCCCFLPFRSLEPLLQPEGNTKHTSDSEVLNALPWYFIIGPLWPVVCVLEWNINMVCLKVLTDKRERHFAGATTIIQLSTDDFATCGCNCWGCWAGAGYCPYCSGLWEIDKVRFSDWSGNVTLEVVKGYLLLWEELLPARILTASHLPPSSHLTSHTIVSFWHFSTMRRYLIAPIVRRRLPTIERHIRETTLVATAPHASVWIALSCTLVDAHAPARPLVIASKPLSTRPPTPLTQSLHTGALAKHWCVLRRQRNWNRMGGNPPVWGRPCQACSGDAWELSSCSSSSTSPSSSTSSASNTWLG